ncbi:MAG: hypothetical protein WDZ56_00550 [Candidatus Paceibacterota bacterium]
MNIIPAIIPDSLAHLQESLARVGFTKRVQIDVVDGEFVNHISWPYEPAGNIADVADLISEHDVEVDLMVNDSVRAAGFWLEAGAKALVFHIEGVPNMDDVFALREKKPFQLGISLNNDTPLEVIHSYLDKVDFVQVMGIVEIGSQGQPFDSRALERVAMLRSLYPGLILSVDGAVSEENILELKNAGADHFVVGSSILNANNPEQKYQELLRIVQG